MHALSKRLPGDNGNSLEDRWATRRRPSLRWFEPFLNCSCRKLLNLVPKLRQLFKSAVQDTSNEPLQFVESIAAVVVGSIVSLLNRYVFNNPVCLNLLHNCRNPECDDDSDSDSNSAPTITGSMVVTDSVQFKHTSHKTNNGHLYTDIASCFCCSTPRLNGSHTFCLD